MINCCRVKFCCSYISCFIFSWILFGVLGKSLHFEPNEWGWSTTEQEITAVWMTLPEAPKSCRELTKCYCKSNCTRQRKCKKHHLSCTVLCKCICKLQQFSVSDFWNLQFFFILLVIHSVLSFFLHFFLILLVIHSVLTFLLHFQ